MNRPPRSRTACRFLPPEGAVCRGSEPAMQAWTARRRAASRSPAPAVWRSQSRGPGLGGKAVAPPVRLTLLFDNRFLEAFLDTHE